MVDHSNQIGPEKVMVALGVDAEAMPEPGKTLTHEDVRVLEVKPGDSWPGALPVYLGDDDKDEEAFDVVKERGGIAILVAASWYPLSGRFYLDMQIPARFGVGVTPSDVPANRDISM